MLPPERPLPPLIKRFLRIGLFRLLSTVASSSRSVYHPPSCATSLSSSWPWRSDSEALLDPTYLASPILSSRRRFHSHGRKPASGRGRMSLWLPDSGSMGGSGAGGSSLSARRRVVLLLVLQSSSPLRARVTPLASIDLDRVRGLGSIVCLSAAVGIGIGGVIAYRLFSRYHQQRSSSSSSSSSSDVGEYCSESSAAELPDRLVGSNCGYCCGYCCPTRPAGNAVVESNGAAGGRTDAASTAAVAAADAVESESLASSAPLSDAGLDCSISAAMGNTQLQQQRRQRRQRPADAMEMQWLPGRAAGSGSSPPPESHRLLGAYLPEYRDRDDGNEFDDDVNRPLMLPTSTDRSGLDDLLESAEEALPNSGAPTATEFEIRNDSLRAVSSLESVGGVNGAIKVESNAAPTAAPSVAWPGTAGSEGGFGAGRSPLHQQGHPLLPGYVTERNQELFNRVMHIYARVHSSAQSESDSGPALADAEADLDAEEDEKDASLGAEFLKRRDEISGRLAGSQRPASSTVDVADPDAGEANDDEDVNYDEEDDELTRQQLLNSLRQGESLFSDGAGSSTAVATTTTAAAGWLMEDSGVDLPSTSVEPPSTASDQQQQQQPPQLGSTPPSDATLLRLESLLRTAAELANEASQLVAEFDTLASSGRCLADGVANVERQLTDARSSWEEVHSTHLLASSRLSHSSSFGLDLDLSSGDWSLYDEALQDRIGEIFHKAGLTESPLAQQYRERLRMWNTTCCHWSVTLPNQ